MDFLTNIPWSKIWLVIKIIILFVDAIIIGVFVFALGRAWRYRPKLRLFPKRPKRAPTLRTEALKEHWNSILENLNVGTPESRKFAIIEADALVDDILKRLGYEGEYMADRLAKLDVQDFPSVEKLWRAHRVRNELAHTPGFEISHEHAKSLIEIYEDFLKEVGVLQ